MGNNLKLKFLQDFFQAKRYNLDKNTTITLAEEPCYQFGKDDYTFRVELAEVIEEIDLIKNETSEKPIYRKLAIEHQPQQLGHNTPHLQFKLHSDKVGKIYILLPVDNGEQFKAYVQSFLDIVGNILIRIDNKNKDLQQNFMILPKFKGIKGKGELIKNLILELYLENKIEIITVDKLQRILAMEDIKKIKQVPQLLPFFERI